MEETGFSVLSNFGAAWTNPGRKKLRGETLPFALMPLQPVPTKIITDIVTKKTQLILTDKLLNAGAEISNYYFVRCHSSKIN
ncbi:MAG: hypothetical protein M3Y82_12480 [Verrucomicrobiota bacterium]|nr:hypothetical protein [Verrucomicrobiota bacterium]